VDKIDKKTVSKLFHQNLGARAIAKKLGYKNHASVTKCLRRLGLVRSGPCLIEGSCLDLKFIPKLGLLRRSSEYYAKFIFAHCGYEVSTPNSSESYDLLVKINGTFQKIQIKSSDCVKDSGNCEFRLCKTRNNGNESRLVYYKEGECDYFFLMDRWWNVWLIPFSILKGKRTITPALKYPGYQILPQPGLPPAGDD
jgi:PD-(D/E)XK endonuclease